MLGLVGFIKKNLELQGKLPDKWKDGISYYDISKLTLSMLNGKEQFPTGTFKANKGSDIVITENDHVMPAQSPNGLSSTPAYINIETVTGTSGFADKIKASWEADESNGTEIPFTATGAVSIEFDIKKDSIVYEEGVKRLSWGPYLYGCGTSAGKFTITVTYVDNTTTVTSGNLDRYASNLDRIQIDFSSTTNQVANKGIKHIKIEISNIKQAGSISDINPICRCYPNSFSASLYLTSQTFDFGDEVNTQIQITADLYEVEENPYTGVVNLGTGIWTSEIKTNEYNKKQYISTSLTEFNPNK